MNAGLISSSLAALVIPIMAQPLFDGTLGTRPADHGYVTHSRSDRAGFSLIVLAEDRLGIELGV